MKKPIFIEKALSTITMNSEHFSKFHLIIHLNLFLLKYISIMLYHDIKSSETNSKVLDEIILRDFRNPTEGQWLTLFEKLLSEKKDYFEKHDILLKRKFNTEISELFNTAFSIFINNELAHDNKINIFNYFRKIISIKNKLVSHGIIPSDQAAIINQALFPATKKVIEEIFTIFDAPIYLVEENYNGEREVVDYYNPNDIRLQEKNANESGLCSVFGKKIIHLNPFLICRDGEIFFYNKFDKKHKKTFYSCLEKNDIYRKESNEDLAQVFSIDTFSLNIKSLAHKVKRGKTGIFHNLPDLEKAAFIGRKLELQKLSKYIAHKRNYLTALDGIGGVGKTAIAQEYCRKQTEEHNDEDFEFIIWVSAKATKLYQNRIVKLEQVFEHLEQLLDTILDVLSFSEYKDRNIEIKLANVEEILDGIKVLLVIDNLETITSNNLEEIWNFVNNIPSPVKVILTSREYHYKPNQVLSIDKLSLEDSEYLFDETMNSLQIEKGTYGNIKRKAIELSSGIPIALISIIGQITMGKNIRSIERDLVNNENNITEFCFKEQIKQLDDDSLKVILIICKSKEELDYEAIEFILGKEMSNDLDSILNKALALSIIKMGNEDNATVYTILPIIKNYIESITDIDEYKNLIQKKLIDYYDLKSIDEDETTPNDELDIGVTSLYAKKMADRAMMYAESGEYAEAESQFKRCINDYQEESYVWYIYSKYQNRFENSYEEAINSLKKANSINPNFIFNKTIGDLHLKIRNFDASIRNYQAARKRALTNHNKDEMLYQIAQANYSRAKEIRRYMRNAQRYEMSDLRAERDDYYKETLNFLKDYIKSQKDVYDGKKAKIFRMMAESCFGLRDSQKALEYINIAIDHSDYDGGNAKFKKIILNRMNEVNATY